MSLGYIIFIHKSRIMYNTDNHNEKSDCFYDPELALYYWNDV